MSARKWAGMWLEIVLKVVRVYVWVHFGSIFGSNFDAFDGSMTNLLLTWNGKRVFIVLRFFPSLLVFLRLFSLPPASAGGPAGRLFTFLPVSSFCFRVSSRFSPPLRAERAGRRDDYGRFFPSLHTHKHTNNNNHSNNSGLSTTEMYDVKCVIVQSNYYYYY